MKKEKIKGIDFKFLDYEFEISEIESEEFVLRNIRKKICDKLEISLKLLEDVMQPNGISALIEVKELNDNDGKKAFELYKQIMIYLRKATELFYEDSDKENIEFIKEITKKWPDLKKGIIDINKKLSKVWTKPSIKKEQLGYLG